MNGEIEKINRAQRDKKLGQLLTSKINDRCTAWLDELVLFFTIFNPFLEFVQLPMNT